MVAVKNIARRLGDDISEPNPILDSRLPDGSRVAAVIPPCSMRRCDTHNPQVQHSPLQDGRSNSKCGTLDAALADRLEDYVLSRKNILISGGTGTGKSTTLGILAKFIPEEERILLIEDTAEIHLDQPNLVRFEARQEQTGVRRRTHSRPIEGRASAPSRSPAARRGYGVAEAFELLQLLNTGHSGTLSTIHANSATASARPLHELRSRKRCGDCPIRSIKTNIGDSLNAVVHIERRPGCRFISEVVELHGYDPDADLFNYCPVFHKEEGNAWPRLSPEHRRL